MTWQNCGLLFLAIVGTCFLIAFIEVLWKSRNYYYAGKAKPRESNRNRRG